MKIQPALRQLVLALRQGKVNLCFTAVVLRAGMIDDFGFALFPVMIVFTFCQLQLQLFIALFIRGQAVCQLLLGAFQFNAFIAQIILNTLAVKAHHRHPGF